MKREVNKALKEKGINVVHNGYVEEITESDVKLKDGRSIECNVAVWATGAQP